MTRVTAADWRRWGLLGILARDHGRAFKTDALLDQFYRAGWGHLLPSNGRWDTLHRDLTALEKAGKVRRDGRPARWRTTDLGHDFAREFIVGNANIAPEKSAAASAPPEPGERDA